MPMKGSIPQSLAERKDDAAADGEDSGPRRPAGALVDKPADAEPLEGGSLYQRLMVSVFKNPLR